VKSRGMNMAEVKNTYNIVVGNLRGRGHMKGIYIDGSIILKLIW
jgi:hypothetical protein